MWVLQHHSVHAFDMSTIAVFLHLGLQFKWNQFSSNNSRHTSCIHKRLHAERSLDLLTSKPDLNTYSPHSFCRLMSVNFMKIRRWEHDMMTSSNGNIFRVTGPLCGEFTGHRWIPQTKTSDGVFYLRLNGWSKQSRRWRFGTPSRSLWRHRNAKKFAMDRSTDKPTERGLQLLLAC